MYATTRGGQTAALSSEGFQPLTLDVTAGPCEDHHGVVQCGTVWFPSGDETEGKKGYPMAQKVMIKHPASGLVKTGFYGFSWTYLFFGWFVPLFRGELGAAALHLLFTMFTFGIWQFIVAFLYNNQYMTRMLGEKGYVLADSESTMMAARQKLGIAAPV